MTLSVTGAFSDHQITRDEGRQLIADAQDRAGMTAATPEAMEGALRTHLEAEGMTPSSATAAAHQIVDRFGGRSTGPLAALPFPPEQCQFRVASMPTTGSGTATSTDSTATPRPASAGLPAWRSATTPEARERVYGQIADRMRARLGGRSDWSALGQNACHQVRQELRDIREARQALRDLNSGDAARIASATATLARLSTHDSAVSRSIDIFRQSTDLTAEGIGRMVLRTVSTGPLFAPVMAGVEAGMAVRTQAARLEQSLGRLEEAFSAGNQRIYDNIVEGYDQYLQGGAAAVTDPDLRHAFELTERAEQTSDPGERRSLLHQSTVAIARHEQTMIQGLFDQVGDLMDNIEDIQWTPPGTSDSQRLGSGRQWRQLEGRLGIIEREIMPRFGL